MNTEDQNKTMKTSSWRPTQSVQRQTGATWNGSIRAYTLHKLKNRILSFFPNMKAYTQGREVVMVFNGDVGGALGKACEHDADSDAVHFKGAPTIVRRDMFQVKMEFNGSFDIKCREQSVPLSLVAVVTQYLQLIATSAIQQHKA